MPVEDDQFHIVCDPSLDNQRVGNVVGFALAVPQGESLEVLYLGVDPEVWGAGVGARLLRHLDDYASSKAHGELELWVIAHNERAIALYERAGWQATDEVKIRSAAGRLERRFVRRVPLTRVDGS